MSVRFTVLAVGAVLLTTPAELPTQSVVRTFSVTNATGGVTFDPVARELYVVVLSDRVRVIPVDGGTQRTVTLPPPPNTGLTSPSVSDVCVNGITQTLWIADDRGHAYETDLSGNATGRIFSTAPAAPSPRTIAWNPAAERVLIASSGASTIEAFDTDGTHRGSTSIPIGTATIRGVDWDPSRRQFLVTHDDQITAGRYSAEGTMLRETSLRSIDVWPAGATLDLRAETVFIVDDRTNQGTVHEVRDLWPAAPSGALESYGSGCPLPGAFFPTLVVTGPPIVGGHLAVGAVAPPGSVVVLIWGFDPVTMNLGFLGFPQCSLWTAPWVTFEFAPAPTDRHAVLLAIPAAQLGAKVELQAVVLSAGGALATTSAATLRASALQ